MDVITYEVRGRVKGEAISTASIADFELGPGAVGDQAEGLAANRAILPYCIDPLRGEVVLVETSRDVDLTAAPFVYEAQYQHAERIHTLSIDHFIALAQALPVSARPLFLHSTGRCGSTLLARALGGAEGVTMLSEPDVFSQLAMAGRLAEPAVRARFAGLQAALLRFFMRERADLVAFKFRAIVSEHADYLAAAWPGAVSVFLYRNAIAVARSYAQVTNRPLSSWRLTPGQTQAWARFAPLITQLEGPLGGHDLMAALWAGPMLRYLDSWPQGVWRGCLNYADLVKRPEATGQALFEAAGLGAQHRALPLEAFARHAQADSHLAPDRQRLDPQLGADLASPDFADRIVQSLRRIDPRLSADMVLPGGLRLP